MEISMKTFMIIAFIVGLTITVLALKISQTTRKCDDEKVNSSVKGLIAVGVILISVSLTFLACGCSSGLSEKFTGTLFIAFFTALGVVLITLSSLIHNSDNCGVVKSDTAMLISCGSIMTGFGVLYLSYKMYGKYGRGVTSSM
jgi:hypothetical protein